MTPHRVPTDREPLPLGPALLFCPGDRPDRFAKAAERADAVILDLEDAVAPEHKAAARTAVAVHELDPARTVVRVNPPGTADFLADVAALAPRRPRRVMLPKAGCTADVDRLVAALPGVRVVVLCETAPGVLAAPALAAHPDVDALMWGGEDLVASLGGTSSRGADGGYRDVVRHARSTVLLAARAHGRSAIDAIHTEIADEDGQRAEAEDAAASGFTATACIHPGQVPVIRAAYAPAAEDLSWARDVLAAAEAHGDGVFTHRGRMVDGPILRHARVLVGRAEALAASPV
ncbi:HpcH/HpaI aldolase/citrate lyase family protein [Brachybacterium saurashtrense]|uniref:CoA ester lyase n=1 Tax=Brachybacterium saurashtrense TaxID=556288 RepID=A0A345YRX4_9MICO|nr:CoA ester lyase [Brachybacterium saurashtrense]AXK46676.1 CoA ester lyase [Brachybacterium saurashtrense]RRR22390.1 CoA ester lyase [Brachybacterium saurashtrense]